MHFFFFFSFSVSLAWIIFGVVVRKGKLFKGIKHGGATIWFFIAVKNSCYSWTQYKSWLSGSDLRYPDSSPCRSCFGWLWCFGYPACKPGLNFCLQKRDCVSGFLYFFNNSWFTHYCVVLYHKSEVQFCSHENLQTKALFSMTVIKIKYCRVGYQGIERIKWG